MLGPFSPLELLALLDHEHGWPVFTALELVLAERHRPRRPQTLAERNAAGDADVTRKLVPVVPKADVARTHTGPRPKWRPPT